MSDVVEGTSAAAEDVVAVVERAMLAKGHKFLWFDGEPRTAGTMFAHALTFALRASRSGPIEMGQA
jgi:hypothetical protein